MKQNYMISCFPKPVTNKTEQYKFSWSQLYDQLIAYPRVLPEYTPAEKMKNGDYYVRGAIANGEPFPERCDENLASCNLAILDIDHPSENHPLPTPLEIHEKLKNKNIAHVVHTSANPARCRIVMPSLLYNKEDTAAVTWCAYCFMQELGIQFAFATESRTCSQPWFLPQTSNIELHRAFGCKTGKKFDPYPLQKAVPIPESEPPQTNSQPPPDIGSVPTAAWLIEQIQKYNTLHQAAKRYAGWLKKTTDWSMGQIFDEITGLVDTANVEEFITRWPAERKKLEAWFEAQNFEDTPTFDPQVIKTINTQDLSAGLGASYIMEDTYLKELGEEEWAYKDLVIARHITVIIARPGGGKTSFLLNVAAPEMVKKGYTVYYIDVDSPPSDHKRMHAISTEHRFFLVAPNTHKDKSLETYMETMDGYIELGTDMTKSVFIFDTFKRFANMMNKKDLVKFLSKMRKLTNLGATVVLLGHANKHLDPSGLMIFEGTGDVIADCDNLLFFAAEHNNDEMKTKVTTIIDQNLGAKMRGIFHPFTFEVSKETRAVRILEDAPPVQYPLEGPVTATQITRAVINDSVVLKAGVDFLKENTDKDISTEVFLTGIQSKVDTGMSRIRRLVVTNTMAEGIELGLALFETKKGGERNHLKFYSLTKRGENFEAVEGLD